MGGEFMGIRMLRVDGRGLWLCWGFVTVCGDRDGESPGGRVSLGSVVC